MQKYLQIIKATAGEYMAYRLSFVLWRFRIVIQLLITYFLWWAIFSQPDLPAGRQALFGYTQQTILTYILLSSLVRPLIMGTRTQEVGNLIVNGDLANFLLRPFRIVSYFISRDIADKLLNLFFAVFEVSVLLYILKPPLFLQTNASTLLLTVLALGIGTILFFYFSILLSLLGFWTPDVWAPRFLSFILTEFFAGMLFPLDILPKPLFVISQLLPFSYFIYFPLKVYLGELSGNVLVQGLSIGFIWIILFHLLYTFVWMKGLKVFTAVGR